MGGDAEGKGKRRKTRERVGVEREEGRTEKWEGGGGGGGVNERRQGVGDVGRADALSDLVVALFRLCNDSWA